jgi:hypothetical protein
MSLRGNLETFFFASVLQFLSNERKTGILFLKEGEDNEVKVYIRDGTIIHASGSQKEARLAHILKSRGIVPAEDLKAALETAREKKMPYGKVLVERGLISLDLYRKFARKQAEEIIYKLFLWKKGEFEYKDQALNLDEDLIINLNTVEVILEASRRIDEMSVLVNQIPNSGMVLKISEKYPDKREIKLNAAEWHLLSLIDGRRTVRDIIEASGLDEFPVYKLLFSLLSSGLIEKTEKPAAQREEFFDAKGVATVYSDIFQIIHKKSENELGNRAGVLFEESKSKLNSKQRILYRNLKPGAPVEENTAAVLSALAGFKDPGVSGVDLLIGAGNDYLAHLLGNLKDHLGQALTRDILAGIEGVLGYVNTYHGNSAKKDMIINGIHEVMSLVEELGKDGKKRGGVLGLFRP